MSNLPPLEKCEPGSVLWPDIRASSGRQPLIAAGPAIPMKSGYVHDKFLARQTDHLPFLIAGRQTGKTETNTRIVKRMSQRLALYGAFTQHVTGKHRPVICFVPTPVAISVFCARSGHSPDRLFVTGQDLLVFKGFMISMGYEVPPPGVVDALLKFYGREEKS